MANRRCKHHACAFTATGTVIVTLVVDGSRVLFGLCAVHRDDVVDDLITNPSVASVAWKPRDTWSLDGASA